MNLKQLLTLLSFVLSAHMVAQITDGASQNFNPFFLKGDQALNLNVGFLSASDYNFSLFQASGAGDPSPSVQLSYEYGLTDQISIAGFASYYRVDASTSFSVENLADQISGIDINDLGSLLTSFECIINPSSCGTEIAERVNVFTFGGKLRYSRSYLDNIETYATTYLGYSINKRETITEQALNGAIDQLGLNTEVPSFLYYGGVGARMFVTDQIGLYGEFGYGNVNLLKLGVSYRM